MSSSIDRLQRPLEGRYRVDRELGAGGMATVYLAHDLKHDRDVAIKVLHPDLGAALGGERFLTEIRTTARLQHPHILPLLDSGEADGLLYYVMPLVTGETLRARLERERQLPIADAVRIAREVASALDYAHRHNVIHRDIKPENILLHDGQAIVADFGIALAVQSAGGARMTQTGLSLGTPSYMSPEQAMGERTIDARSDIYALGAVTYEMLAGEPPFTGASVQAIVAKVLASAPEPLHTLRKTVPAHVEATTLAALSKLPADRPATAKAFAEGLVTATMSADVSRLVPAAVRRSRFSLALAPVVAILAASAGWWVGQRSGDTSTTGDRVAVDVSIGRAEGVTWNLDLSPDGKSLAVVSHDSLGRSFIRVRDLSVDSVRMIAGSEGAVTVDFTLDGKALLFVKSSGEMRSIPLTGGASTLLANGVFNVKATSGADGWVYHTATAGGLARTRAAGGVTETLTVVDTLHQEFGHWDPQLLPGGKAILFYSYNYPADSSRVEIFDLKSRKRTRLIPHATNPRYIAGGFLTFLRDSTVMAVRFDVDNARLEGNAVPVLTDVAWDQTNGNIAFAVSPNGTLAYVRQSEIDVPQLVREVARNGQPGDLLTHTGRWAEPRLSPDGRSLALTMNGRRWQIWIFDRARRVLSQLTRGAGVSFAPNWTPDGRALIHAAETPVYDIVRTPLDRSVVDSLLTTRRDKVPTSVGPDGRSFSFTIVRNPQAVFVSTGKDSLREIGTTTESRGASVISPDGRWIAYREQTSGSRAEVYVQSLSSPARRQVSADGGDEPRWSKQGRELVYRRNDAIMAAAFDPVTGEPGRPVELFKRYALGRLSGDRTTGYDVSPDGLTFFMIEPQQRDRLASASLIFNWRGDLERALRR